jgi:hypothetical protein
VLRASIRYSASSPNQLREDDERVCQDVPHLGITLRDG